MSSFTHLRQQIRYLLYILLWLTAIPSGAAPVASISANGHADGLSLASGDALEINIRLNANEALGQDADWWAVRYDSASGWAYLNLSDGWQPGLLPSYQGALFELPAYPILSSASLTAGDYQFYFGVDLNMNGQLDMDRAVYDMIAVTVNTVADKRLLAADFEYLGAFRLPGGTEPPLTFAYGGNAMTFNPDGDPGNGDAHPGSLFIMGHDRIAYGGVPDGNQVAELSIPVPALNSPVEQLPQAEFLQGFHNVTAGWFTDMEEIPKVGMAYLNHPLTGPKIHLVWGQHLQPENAPSHAWFNPALDNPDLRGAWFLGYQNLYSVNGYALDIPAAWADAHVQGRYLASGRMRDGGQGGMGPTLFAYQPWLANGSAPPHGARLAEMPLLLYENVTNTPNIERAMQGYQHADEWEGAAWITTSSGKSALLFAGTKANGSKYWYGYRHPAGPDYPCVDAHVTDFPTCRTAAGAVCPAEDFAGCCDEALENCISYRGWWSTRFDAQFILYDTAQLAAVAAGQLAPWQPQPYAHLDIDERLYLNPPVWDEILVGSGVQRRYRINDVAYDREHDMLYVLEQLADEGKPVVHVWRLH